MKLFPGVKISASADTPLPASSVTNSGLKVLLATWMALTVLLGLTSLRSPAVVPASAPAVDFSAVRAMAHLKIIGQAPHPLGSAEHDAVRDYLMARLSLLGLRPRIQATTIISRLSQDPYRVAHVENVIARLPGTHNTGSVLLAAHYDSVPTGPGASDDGAAVAALLETARALKAGPPLRNDVIFLFTDGEEAGLLGAQAFVKESPEARQAIVALNFEARGTAGPSLMFETSHGNGHLIRKMARAAPYPCASSLFYSVYKRLPNDTDLTEFRRAGLPGLNFAYIDHIGYYHTECDDLAHMELSSLQHHGANMLALARQFGNLSANDLKSEDSIYFNLAGPLMIVYPQVFVWPLAILAAIGCAGIIIIGIRRGQMTVSGVLPGFLMILTTLVVTVIILAAWTVTRTRLYSNPHTLLYSGSLALAGVVGFALSLGFAALSAVSPRLHIDNVAAGGLLWWLLLTLAMSALLPGGSYLFAWPLIGCALAGSIVIYYPQIEKRWREVILVMGATPALLLIPSMLCLLYQALSSTALPVIGALMILTVGLLASQFGMLTLPLKWLTPARLIGVAVLLLLAGSPLPPPSYDHPTTNSLFFGLNADTGRAIWASADLRPDRWTRHFLSQSPSAGPLPELLPNVPGKFLQHDAPTLPLPAPDVTLLEDHTRDGVRTLRLRVRSPRQAACIEVVVEPGTKVVSAAVEDKAIVGWNASEIGRQGGSVFLMAVPLRGMIMTLNVIAKGPAVLRVIDRSYGLPHIPGVAYIPRPSDMMPRPTSYWFEDTTLVSKSYRL